MQKVRFTDIDITGGFWKKKQGIVRNVTASAVYDRFYDTGRIDAFKMDWQEGMPHKPHIFWDSDVAKWMEGAAYLIAKKRDSALEKKVDSLVKLIQKNQAEDGYFNTYYQTIEPSRRFTDRSWHELYCAGHLTEAAIAYCEATGKKTFLACMKKYMDYIYERFYVKKDTPFKTPGHEEIEIALVKLYDYTKEEKYLTLAKYFIDVRGVEPEPILDFATAEYNQSHAPVREQFEAKGHAVRAVYLYCAMADIAYRTGDESLKHACEMLFDDIASKKMYITGAIGSSSGGESFTGPYDLPNLLAYTETCASIGLALFANRMLQFGADSKYSDCIERLLYNGLISALSLDGKAFFYENPLEVIPYLASRDTSVRDQSVNWPQMHRAEVFGCSCCPPNVVRFVSSVADMMYSEDGKRLYIHQFMQGKTTVKIGGIEYVLTQTTRYPESGKVTLCVKGGDLPVSVRIPWWSENDFSSYTIKNGYAEFVLSDGIPVTFDFGMPVRYIEARPEVQFDCNRYAVMRGPVVYCLEGVDNPGSLRDIRLDSHSRFVYGRNKSLGVPSLTVRAYKRISDGNAPLYQVRKASYEKTTATLIPYYAFANRGISPMQVWNNIK